MTKMCPRCRETKPVLEFNKCVSKRDGFQTYCKPCHVARNQEWVEKNREKRAATLRASHRKKPPGWRRERTRDYRSRNPEKYYAHNALYAAVRDGRLTKLDTCEDCGGPDPQGHHDDYSKPLDVRWLCRVCHASVHRRAA